MSAHFFSSSASLHKHRSMIWAALISRGYFLSRQNGLLTILCHAKNEAFKLSFVGLSSLLSVASVSLVRWLGALELSHFAKVLIGKQQNEEISAGV